MFGQFPQPPQIPSTAIVLAKKFEPRACEECKAPIDDICKCDSCDSRTYTSTYCHVCREEYEVISSRTYWNTLSAEWKREQEARKKRMGLSGSGSD